MKRISRRPSCWRGLFLFRLREFEHAEDQYQAAIKAFPEDKPLYQKRLVETMAARSTGNQAIEVMSKAMEAEPDRRDLKLFKANSLVRDEKYDEAIRIFQALLVKDPKSADLLLRLAESYRRKGDLNSAIDAFRRCSQAAPADPAPLLQLGLWMEATGRRDQAQPIYEQILRIKPDHAVPLNNLAVIKADKGIDLDQALTMAPRARQQPPASPDFADTLGWIYIK